MCLHGDLDEAHPGVCARDGAHDQAAAAAGRPVTVRHIDQSLACAG